MGQEVMERLQLHTIVGYDWFSVIPPTLIDGLKMFSPKLRVTALFFAATVAFIASGCSLISDFDECESDSDCGGATCSDGICQTSGSGTACTTTSDCANDELCINQSCGEIDTNLCVTDESEILDEEDVYYISMLMPLTGRNGAKGIAATKGARTGLRAINDQGGVKGSRIGLIACDTKNDPATAVQTARHVDSLGINVMIGALASDSTLDIANNVALENDAVVISPASTAPSISSLETDSNLIWRTVPSDANQGVALAALVEKEGFNTIAVFYADTAYGNGLFTALTRYWTDNNQSDRLEDTRFQTIQYQVSEGDIDAGTFTTDVTELFDTNGYMPEAILILGSTESQQIIFSVDDQFFGSMMEDEKPQWVLTDGGREAGLFDSRFDAQRARIQGTFPEDVEGSAFSQFRLAYEIDWELLAEQQAFADNSFDAAYLAALAIGAQDDVFAATGSSIGEVLTRVSAGDTFIPGDTFQAATNSLAAGGTINYDGASGDVDFDENGDTKAAIENWALSADMDEFISNGNLVDADGNIIP